MTAQTVPQFTQADKLRKAREHAGLEQQQLADLIAVSRATISNAERGRNRPHRLMVRAWAAATGVPVEWLEWAPGDSNPQPTDYGYAQVAA